MTLHGDIPGIYADASVFGGVFDDEFARPSSKFFQKICAEEFRLVVSELVRGELAAALETIRNLWKSMLPESEIISVSDAVLELQQANFDSDILTVKSANDALHLALATVHRCTAIVSRNFRHIVHFEKIRRYNQVNTLRGHDRIAIHSPAEVVAYEYGDEEF